MELKFLTPTAVWEGFDATKASLEASIISATTTNNFSCEKHVFTAETLKDERLRIECDVYFDARWQDARPALLLLPSFENPHHINAVRNLVEEGFAVCVLDYCGVLGESKTSFPQNLLFARYPECLEHLDHIETDAKNTPWFVWGKIARRAISLLQEKSFVQNDRIGVMGFGIGAQLCYIVAGVDKRAKAVVALNGGGYRWAEHNARFLGSDIPSGDEQIAYSTGVGAETYANFITCPTLIIATRDSALCDIDRIGDMFDLVKGEAKQMIISSSSGWQITKNVYTSMVKWLRQNLAVDAIDKTPQPSIRFEATGGKLYVKVNCVEDTQERTLFVSYGEPSSKHRHWESFDIKQKVGANEYICDIPVYDLTELVVAYATLTYPDGDVFSTKVVGTTGAKHNIERVDTSVRTSNIIFDGSMDADEFVAKTNDALLLDNAVEVTEGPFGIEGVSAKQGNLILARSIQEMRAIPRNALLHVDAYSPLQRELDLCVYSFPDLKKYTSHKHLQGGEFWQKLLFEVGDFKSDEGRALSSFENVKTIEIVDVDGILLNNFLWI